MSIKRTPVFLLALIAAVGAKEIEPAVPSQSLNGCYQISTAEELYGFAEIVNGHDSTAANTSACGELTKDIVVNDSVLNKWAWPGSDGADSLVVWEPIKDFSGTFNGNGHVISGLFSDKNSGLFESLVSSSEHTVVVRDLGIVDSYFLTRGVAGVLAENVSGDGEAQITNFYSLSTLEVSRSEPNRVPIVGGVVGFVSENTSLTLTNCYSAGKLVDNKYDFYSQLLGYPYSEKESIKVNNCYVLKKGSSNNGILVDSAAFRNGAVAFLLRENLNGAIWGQDVGKDSYPVFSGELKNSIAGRYTVEFHTFDGDTAKYFDEYVAGLTTMLPKGTSKENLVFGGWYRDAEFSGKNDTAISNTTTGNLEYWARMYDRYKVTYHSNGGTRESGSYIACGNPTASYQDALILKDSVECYLGGIGGKLSRRYTRNSSIFVGWYDNEELAGSPVDSITTSDKGDKEFYAKWFEYKRPAIDPVDSCYVISSAEELYGFSALVDGSFTTGIRNEDERPGNVCGKLTKDIVVNENVLKRDGSLDSSRIKDFIPWKTIIFYNGFFDGQGHTISGLYMENSDGMFATGQSSEYFETKVVIHNLKVRDSFLSGNYSVGGIITSHSKAFARIEIENTHFDGTIVAKSNIVGGLVSEAHYPLVIKNSSHRGIIDIGRSARAVGGLVGHSDYSTYLIQNSNEGRFVAGEESEELLGAGDIGGLIGEVSKRFFILNNYNAADFDCRGCIVNGLIGDYYIETSQLSIFSPFRPTTSFVLNNHSKGSIVNGRPSKLDDWVVTFDNNFYLEGTLSRDSIGTPVKASAFEDGTVTKALHDYVQKDADGNEITGGALGANWIQGDEYPVLTGSETRDVAWLHVSNYSELFGYVLFYTPGEELSLPTPSMSGYTFLGWELGDEMVTAIPSTASGNLVISAEWKSIPSSSSVAASSSSTAKSSSSEAKSSSSNAKSSSSTAKSSSSSAGGKSSSSKGKDAIVANGIVPHFSLTTAGRDILVAHARVGAAYAVFDMQGRVMMSGRVAFSDFSLTVPCSATYLVRIGGQLQKVSLK